MNEAESRTVYVKIPCSIIEIIKYVLDFSIYYIYFYSCDLKAENNTFQLAPSDHNHFGNAKRGNYCIVEEN